MCGERSITVSMEVEFEILRCWTLKDIIQQFCTAAKKEGKRGLDCDEMNNSMPDTPTLHVWHIYLPILNIDQFQPPQ